MEERYFVVTTLAGADFADEPVKPHKMTVFDTDPRQCVFWRVSQRNSAVIDVVLRLRPKAGRETSLPTNIASRPKGTLFGLETGTYGHHSVGAGELDAQIGAQNPQLAGSQAPGPL